MQIATRATNAWNHASDRQRTTALVLLVVAAAVIPYLNSLSNGFAFDDAYIIQNNRRVHNLGAWREIFLTPYWPSLGRELGLYRPLTILLFAIQWAIGDGARWVFHLVNICMHAAVSVLVFLLLSRLTSRIPAALGAVVFAVHPLHTEAVANMVGQAELTAAAFVLIACLIHAGRPDGLRVSWTRRIAITGLFLLALLAKESAVVLPGLLVLIDLLQRRVPLDRRGMLAYGDALAVVVVMICGVLVAYLAARYNALDASLIGADAGPAFPHLKEHRLLNAFRAFPEYLRLLFFPVDLTTDYVPATIFAVTTFTMMVVLGLGLLLGLTALMLMTPWAPIVGGPPAWFLISISPVSNIFFPIGVLIAERTLYLPSVALSLLVAYVVANMSPEISAQGRRNAAIAFACAILAMGYRSWIRNPDWKNTSAVQNAVLRDHPESYHAQWARALVEWDRGNLDEASRWFRIALRTYPRDSGMLGTYGAFLTAVGEDSLAINYVRTAYDLHPFMPNSAVLLPFLFITNRQPDSALVAIARTERANFPMPVTMAMRAYVYQSQGKLAETAAAWRFIGSKEGRGKWLAHAYLARTLAYDGNDQGALAALDTAFSLTTDTLNRSVVDLTRAAVTNGCYRRDDPAAIRELYGPPTRPICDPLGSWFERAMYVQRATFSQYAIPRRLIPAVTVRGDTIK